METLIQQIVNGLVLGSLYSLIALGYTMVYGILNLINFAHGDVLMIGALTALSLILFLQQYGDLEVKTTSGEVVIRHR